MFENCDTAINWLLLDEVHSREEDAVKLWGKDYRDWLISDYWDPLCCNALSSGVDYFIFDLGFRFTPALVLKWMKTHYSVSTQSALLHTLCDRQNADSRELIFYLDGLSRNNLRSLPEWKAKCSVWTNRANRVRDRALKVHAKRSAKDFTIYAH